MAMKMPRVALQVGMIALTPVSSASCPRTRSQKELGTRSHEKTANLKDSGSFVLPGEGMEDRHKQLLSLSPASPLGSGFMQLRCLSVDSVAQFASLM